MLLTRQGQLLILRSRTMTLWGGLFFAGAALVMLYVLVRHESGGLLYWLVVSISAGVAAIACFMMLPQTVTTIFDPEHGQVTHTRRFGHALVERTRTYGFGDIESIGLKEAGREPLAYIPVLRLKGGKSRLLAVDTGSYFAHAEVIKIVCEATGLPNRDSDG
jgi:hypothetical protein